jgi:hypothetical protein
VISPIVVYLGPSMIDGAPIVVLASCQSSNVKTGAMIQTWIMRADRNPVEVSENSQDSSVCGGCPRRHSLGGNCYVPIWQAPRSVWSAWERAGKPGENWAHPAEIVRLQQDASSHGLRLGSYGDPAAVPHTVWQDLIDALQPRKVVGYTHQWRGAGDWYRENLMASCDTPLQAMAASVEGWRTFLAIGPEVVPPAGSIRCPATRDVDPVTCRDCGLCAGSKLHAKSIFLMEHGTRSQGKAKRSKMLAVLPCNP